MRPPTNSSVAAPKQKLHALLALLGWVRAPALPRACSHQQPPRQRPSTRTHTSSHTPAATHFAYLKILHSMCSRPSMVASSAIISSTRAFCFCTRPNTCSVSAMWPVMQLQRCCTANAPITERATRPLRSQNAARFVKGNSPLASRAAHALREKFAATQGAGSRARQPAHRVSNVDLGPVVQLQVVALVQHDRRDALPAENPHPPAPSSRRTHHR